VSRSFRMTCNSETDALRRLMMLSSTARVVLDWVDDKQAHDLVEYLKSLLSVWFMRR